MRTLSTVLCLLMLPALAGGQSLAEAARKERERRERLRKAGTSSRTLTEEDLKASKGTLANDPETSQPATEEASEGESSPQAARRQPRQPSAAGEATVDREAYWRDRAAKARARVERAQRRYDRLDRMIRIGQPAMYDENGKRVIYSMQRMKSMADEAQAELEAAKQALDALLDEARRAGALPGWLR